MHGHASQELLIGPTVEHGDDLAQLEGCSTSVSLRQGLFPAWVDDGDDGEDVGGGQRRPLARQSRAGTDTPYSVVWGRGGALVGNLGEHEDDTGSHGMLLQLEQ
jgi:hypothetical protein